MVQDVSETSKACSPTSDDSIVNVAISFTIISDYDSVNCFNIIVVTHRVFSFFAILYDTSYNFLYSTESEVRRWKGRETFHSKVLTSIEAVVHTAHEEDFTDKRQVQVNVLYYEVTCIIYHTDRVVDD